jgi:hypothetical protein
MAKRLQKWLVYKKDISVARLKRALPAPVNRWIKRTLGIRNSIVASAFAATQMASPQIKDEYDRLVAGNVASVLAKVMSRFYGDLGMDVALVPLVKALESFRHSLRADTEQVPEEQAASVLIRFEQAFALSEAGRVVDALPLYNSVFRDTAARAVARYDLFVREVLVRSGKFIGHHQDKAGNTEQAIATYRAILSIDRDGLIARRLVSLLARRGDWREAAEFSETATFTARNLFPHLPKKNRYMDTLHADFLTKYVDDVVHVPEEP